MFFVQDRLTGDTVTWGTDIRRGRQIAAGSELLLCVDDRGAELYWCHERAGGWNYTHPHDQSAREARQAEFEALRQWWLAGGNR